MADCHGDTYDVLPTSDVIYIASHSHDCSNIGGFSDQVFHLLGAFAAQNHSADFWVDTINQIQIAEKAA